MVDNCGWTRWGNEHRAGALRFAVVNDRWLSPAVYKTKGRVTLRLTEGAAPPLSIEHALVETAKIGQRQRPHIDADARTVLQLSEVARSHLYSPHRPRAY